MTDVVGFARFHHSRNLCIRSLRTEKLKHMTSNVRSGRAKFHWESQECSSMGGIGMLL